MKKVLNFIKAVVWALTIGCIVFAISSAILGAYLDAMRGTGGMIIASEILWMEYAPYLFGVLAAGITLHLLDN